MTLRDRLRARSSKLPTAAARIPADPAEAAALEEVVATLETAARRAVAGGLDELAATAQAQLEEARAALAVLPVEVFTFRCLEPKRWEKLVDEHPPSDEERRTGWQWHVETFRPALLAACHIPGEDQEDLDVRGWTEVAEEGQMTPGELERLFATAVQLNARQPSASLGKGSTQTAS